MSDHTESWFCTRCEKEKKNHGIGRSRSSQSTTHAAQLETEKPKAGLLPHWRSTHMSFRTHIWTWAAFEITSQLRFGNKCNRGSEGKSACQQKNRKQILLGPMFCGAIHTDCHPLWTPWLHNNIIWLHVMLPTDRSHNSIGPWRALFLECVQKKIFFHFWRHPPAAR